MILLGATILLLHFGYCFYGHFGFDDLHYARLSAALSRGHWDATDHYAYRLTLLLPTALSYRLFGVSDAASALPPLAMSLGILLVFHQRHGQRTSGLLLALLLYFSFRWNLFYADKLMPDIYVSGFAFIAWHIYTRKKKLASWWWPMLFVGALFAAFNAKGTIILLLPLFSAYFFYDLWRRQHLVFWQRTSLLGCILFSSYFLLTKWGTGHFLARFRAIAAAAYSNTCSYAEQDMGVLLNRLGLGFGRLIYEEGLWIPLAIALPALLYFAWNRFGEAREQPPRGIPLFPLLTIFLLYISANAMTISLTSYNPVCLDARHLLFVSPIAASCSASILEAFLQQLQRRWRPIVYGLLLLLLSWAAYSNIALAQYSRSLGYASVKNELRQLLTDTDVQGRRLLSSPVLINLANYLDGFPEQPTLDFYDIKQELAARGDLLLRNWYCDWHSQIEERFYQEQLANKGLHRETFFARQDYEVLLLEQVK